MRLLVVQVVLVLLPVTMMAQEYPGAELFGGYSYFRSEGGNANLHGWNASIGRNLNRWFGLVADFSGHYGDATESFPTAPGAVQLVADGDASLHTFLFGPRFSYRGNERVVPYFQALFGAARASVDLEVTTPPFSGLRKSESEAAFGMTLGGGLDIKVATKVALRLFQAEYALTRFAEDTLDTQNNMRISTGLVFRFGVR